MNEEGKLQSSACLMHPFWSCVGSKGRKSIPMTCISGTALQTVSTSTIYLFSPAHKNTKKVKKVLNIFKTRVINSQCFLKEYNSDHAEHLLFVREPTVSAQCMIRDYL